MSDQEPPKATLDELVVHNESGHSRLLFHVEKGDYFAVIATLLGFVEDSAHELQEKDEAMRIAENQIMQLRQNLIFLQEHYNITPKK